MKHIIILITCIIISFGIAFYHITGSQSEPEPLKVTEMLSPPAPNRMLEMPEEMTMQDTVQTERYNVLNECTEVKVDTVYIPVETESRPLISEDLFDNLIKLMTVIMPLLVPIVTYKLDKKKNE